MKMVIELAKDKLFSKLAPVSDKLVKERMREELVTRFFAYWAAPGFVDTEIGVTLEPEDDHGTEKDLQPRVQA